MVKIIKNITRFGFIILLLSLTFIVGAEVFIGQPYVSENIPSSGVYITTQNAINYRDYTVARTNTTLYCNYLNISGAPTYQWYKNDVVVAGETSSSLASNNFIKGDNIFCSIQGINSTSRYILTTLIGDFSNGTTNYGNRTYESGNVTLNFNSRNIQDTLLLLHFDNNYTLNTNITDDVSIYNNNGVCNSSINCPTFNSSGYIGGAFEFDGVDDYIDAGDSLVGLDILTYSMWINPSSTPSAQTYLLSTRISGAASGWWVWNNAGSLACLGYNQLSSTFNAIIGTLPLKSWSYITCVYDGTNVISYLNGIKRATSVGTYVSIPNGVKLTIGVDAGIISGRYFNGTIDEVRILNRSLTADEILRDYQAGLKKIQPSLNNYEHNASFTSSIFDLGKNPNMSMISWGHDTPHSSYYYQDNLIFGWDGSNLLNYVNQSMTGTASGGLLVGNNYSIFPDNNATSFDGVDDRINYGDVDALDFTNNTAFSISAWFYPIVSSSSHTVIFGKTNLLSAIYKEYELLINIGTSQLMFYLVDGDGTFNTISTAVSYNQWQHVIVTRDTNGVANMYVNGVYKGTTTEDGDLNNSLNFVIGATSIGTYAFNGTIDEVHIWDRALTSDEIQTMYNISKNKYPITLQTRMGNYYDEGDEDVIFGWHGDSKKDYIGGLVGTENGGVKVNNKEGYLGGGTEFDGSNDCLEVDGFLSNGMSTSAGTISLWIKQDETPLSVANWFFQNKLNTNENINLRMTSATQVGFGMDHDNIPYEIYGSLSGVGVWNHIVATWSGDSSGSDDELALYINGVLKSSTSVANVFDTILDDSFIGSAEACGSNFNGSIDELHIYKRALSSTEVSNLYKSYLNWGNWTNSTGTSGGYYTNSSGELINSTYNGTNARYLQYRAEFETLDSNVTPKLSDVALKQVDYKVKIFNSEPFGNFSLLFPLNGTWTNNNQTYFNLTNVSDMDGTDDLRWDLEIYNLTDGLIKAFYNLTTSAYQLNVAQKLDDGAYKWRARLNDNSTGYDDIYENYLTPWTSYFNLNVNTGYPTCTFTKPIFATGSYFGDSLIVNILCIGTYLWDMNFSLFSNREETNIITSIYNSSCQGTTQCSIYNDTIDLSSIADGTVLFYNLTSGNGGVPL